MAQLSIRDITKVFSGHHALYPTTLDVMPRELVALLGPSGCGKTTLLSIIAGLTTPNSGDVSLDGRSLATWPPERRGIPMIFQDHLLFPNMTVQENIGFGLRMRRTPKVERDVRISEILEAVKLAGLGRRFPAELSGGQRQRVALARAIVLRPKVLLMDEPFSNLDTSLRSEMRELVVDMRNTYGFSGIIVTHDPIEAMTMVDRIAVMKGGTLLQVGTPKDVYENPKSQFVAGFLGPANFIKAEDKLLCIRPEALTIHTDFHEGSLPARIERRLFTGADVELRLTNNSGIYLWRGHAHDSEARLEPGTNVYFSWRPGSEVVLVE